MSVIECKSGKAKPWVGFLREPPEVDDGLGLRDWAVAAHGQRADVIKPLDELWLGHPLFDEKQLCSRMTTALAGEKDNAVDPAKDALRQVTSAAVAERDAHLNAQRGQLLGFVILAVVVTGAPLYTCQLDPDGEVELEPATRLAVKVEEPGAGFVWVINEPEVPWFFDSLFELTSMAGGPWACSA